MKQSVLRILPLVLLFSVGAVTAEAPQQQEDALVRIAEAGMVHQLIDASELDIVDRACNGEALSKPEQLALLEICERVRNSAPREVSPEDMRKACECIEVNRDGMREPRPDSTDGATSQTTQGNTNQEISVDKSNGLHVSVSEGSGVASDETSSVDLANAGSTIDSRNGTPINVATSDATLRADGSNGINLVASGGTLDSSSDNITDGINLDAGSGQVKLFSGLDAQGNTISNITLSNVSSLSNTGNIIVNYDTDGSGGDKFEVQQNGTPAFRVSGSEVDILNNRDLDMNTRNIINVGNISGTSPIGVNDDFDMGSSQNNNIINAGDVAANSFTGGSASLSGALNMGTNSISGVTTINASTVNTSQITGGGSIISFDDSVDFQNTHNISNVSNISAATFTGGSASLNSALNMNSQPINNIVDLNSASSSNINMNAGSEVIATALSNIILNFNSNAGATGTFEIQEGGTSFLSIGDSSLNINGNSVDNIGSTGTNLAGTGGIFTSVMEAINTSSQGPTNIPNDEPVELGSSADIVTGSGLYNSSNNSYVVPADGVYSVTIEGLMSQNTGGSTSPRQLKIGINGNTDSLRSGSFSVDDSSTLFTAQNSLTRYLSLTSGDDIEFFVQFSDSNDSLQQASMKVMRIA